MLYTRSKQYQRDKSKLQQEASRLLKDFNKKNGYKKKKKSKRKYSKRIPRKYEVYISSKWWIKRKNEYYKVYPKVCIACLSTKYVDLHHLLYTNFGRELDEHLVPLCRDCHIEYHALNGTHYNMVKSTRDFIEQKRSLWK